MDAGVHPDEVSIDPAIVRRAAEWMARLWSGNASDEDKAACAAWRAAHPDHECAWGRLQVMEDKLYCVPRSAARRTLFESASAPTTRRGAFRLLGLTLLIGGAAYTVRRTHAWQFAASDYATRTGDLREIELPDRTRVVLNTDSAIDVRFNDGERRVILRAGEILVTTAADPATVHRPFVIESPQGSVRALGTRFTVREDGGLSRVAVYQGAVEIRPAHAGATLRLEAGQRTAYAEDGAQPPEPVQEGAAAWSQGILVAEHLRVADFLAELGRYRPGVLRCEADVADLRVTGVFSLRDTDRALSNLALGLPVEVLYRTRYWVTVRRR